MGGVAWPTVALACGVLGLEAAGWSLALSGRAPVWVASIACTLAAYAGFTVVHEASHGNVHGDVRSMRPLGELLGWLCAVPMLAPFPAFRILHLRHHAHTNHPTKDPDAHVRGDTFLRVLWNCATIVPSYLREIFVGETSRTEAARAVRASSLAALLAMGAAMVALVASGHGLLLLALWVGPAWVADAFLAFAFDWLPHHPHDVRARYRDTRIIDSSWLAWLLLGQSHHLVHHLWPRVPFHRYVAVFRAARPELEAQGASIVRPGEIVPSHRSGGRG